MKTKSLFISTIAMVVLLVVALATGTFAWYQSSLTASVNTATVSAAASNSASLTLQWTDSDPATSASPTIYFGTGADIQPMIPTAALADYDTNIPTGSAPAFTTALMGTLDAVNYTFKTDGTPATPWTQIADDNTASALRISNTGLASASVTANVTIAGGAGSNADILRVAIYIQTAAGVFDLIGVWGATTTSDIWFGEINADDNVNLIKTINSGANKITPTSGASSSFTLASGSSMGVFVYAWLEGTVLDQGRSLDANYTDPTFSITFTATEG